MLLYNYSLTATQQFLFVCGHFLRFSFFSASEILGKWDFGKNGIFGKRVWESGIWESGILEKWDFVEVENGIWGKWDLEKIGFGENGI